MSNGAKSQIVPVALLTCLVLTGVWAVAQSRQAASELGLSRPERQVGLQDHAGRR